MKDLTSLSTVSRDGSKNQAMPKMKAADRAQPNLIFQLQKNVTSNNLNGGGREWQNNPTATYWDVFLMFFLTPFAGRNFWTLIAHCTPTRRKDNVSRGAREGNTAREQETLRAICLSAEMCGREGWLHGGVRKRGEGKLIGLCLFMPGASLNRSWQESERRGSVWLRRQLRTRRETRLVCIAGWTKHDSFIGHEFSDVRKPLDWVWI